MTVEPTFNSDLFTEQTYLVLAPTSTNEPSCSIVSQVGMSSDNAQVRHSIQPSRHPKNDFLFVNNY